MLSKVISGRLYNSITRHNWSLFDYSKGESERKGIYWIYEINLTATSIDGRKNMLIKTLNMQQQENEEKKTR